MYLFDKLFVTQAVCGPCDVHTSLMILYLKHLCTDANNKSLCISIFLCVLNFLLLFITLASSCQYLYSSWLQVCRSGRILSVGPFVLNNHGVFGHHQVYILHRHLFNTHFSYFSNFTKMEMSTTEGHRPKSKVNS